MGVLFLLWGMGAFLVQQPMPSRAPPGNQVTLLLCLCGLIRAALGMDGDQSHSLFPPLRALGRWCPRLGVGVDQDLETAFNVRDKGDTFPKAPSAPWTRPMAAVWRLSSETKAPGLRDLRGFRARGWVGARHTLLPQARWAPQPGRPQLGSAVCGQRRRPCPGESSLYGH